MRLTLTIYSRCLIGSNDYALDPVMPKKSFTHSWVTGKYKYNKDVLKSVLKRSDIHPRDTWVSEALTRTK